MVLALAVTQYLESAKKALKVDEGMLVGLDDKEIMIYVRDWADKVGGQTAQEISRTLTKQISEYKETRAEVEAEFNHHYK